MAELNLTRNCSATKSPLTGQFDVQCQEVVNPETQMEIMFPGLHKQLFQTPQVVEEIVSTPTSPVPTKPPLVGCYLQLQEEWTQARQEINLVRSSLYQNRLNKHLNEILQMEILEGKLITQPWITKAVALGTEAIAIKLNQAKEAAPEQKKEILKEAAQYMRMLNALSNHQSIKSEDKDRIQRMRQQCCQVLTTMGVRDPVLKRSFIENDPASNPGEILEAMKRKVTQDPSLAETAKAFNIEAAPVFEP